ncbi:hypothetical protein ACILDU_09430 [Capnocytophaga canimorsus]|uniref:hypothetical protein n=1 Tax=Capnocytophaga canimorsus TaxID=28188 RepID=UPI0037D9169A
MKKYVLKAIAGIGEPEEEILEHWNEETFKRYQNNELSREENEELTTLAHDLADFECWVEEIEE